MKKEDIKQIFSEVDKDNSGLISASEFDEYIKSGKCHLDKATVDKIKNAIEKAKDSELNLDGFIQVLSG
ncbi:unnamed protein product [Calicophoron daubneyi]|uniref:EF-hand domain-containing protein n=1 Tax=Calicophoron daubneyi TaxID=300641 RepID=A0AAV2TA37_CALDB